MSKANRGRAMFTPANTNQAPEVVNTCTCSYCGAKPTEWCKTTSGYIAQETHSARRVEYQRRVTPSKPPPPEWKPMRLAKARVVTIEVLVPVTHCEAHTLMFDKALALLRSEEGFAQITGQAYVEQSMAEAAEVLAQRGVEL